MKGVGDGSSGSSLYRVLPGVFVPLAAGKRREGEGRAHVLLPCPCLPSPSLTPLAFSVSLACVVTPSIDPREPPVRPVSWCVPNWRPRHVRLTRLPFPDPRYVLVYVRHPSPHVAPPPPPPPPRETAWTAVFAVLARSPRVVLGHGPLRLRWRFTTKLTSKEVRIAAPRGVAMCGNVGEGGSKEVAEWMDPNREFDYVFTDRELQEIIGLMVRGRRVFVVQPRKMHHEKRVRWWKRRTKQVHRRRKKTPTRRRTEADPRERRGNDGRCEPGGFVLPFLSLVHRPSMPSGNQPCRQQRHGSSGPGSASRNVFHTTCWIAVPTPCETKSRFECKQNATNGTGSGQESTGVLQEQCPTSQR